MKVIELICEGTSIEAAIKSAVDESSKTLKNIKQVNVQHIEALVEKNKVVKYRVNVHVSFIIEH